MIGQIDNPVVLILAGGLGSRLGPLTQELPKCLLRVGEETILGRLLSQLGEQRCEDVRIAVCYKADLVEQAFGQGEDYGVRITYLRETRPTGTAGALRYLRRIGQRPVLVINGDLILTLDFRLMLSAHQEDGAVLTVGTIAYSPPMPYGVLRLDGRFVTAIDEKPDWKIPVSAGVYVLASSVLSEVPEGQLDMPDLIRRLINHGRPIAPFDVGPNWRDIGTIKDLETARRLASMPEEA